MAGGSELTGTAPVAAAPRVIAPDAVALRPAKGEAAGSPGRLPLARALPPAVPLAAAELTTARLSTGAQLLLKLVMPVGVPAGALQAPSPLLPAPAADAATLAAALKAGVESSGLFYESHLADWVAGQRSLAAIRTEPQAALPVATAAAEAAPSGLTLTTAMATATATTSTMTAVPATDSNPPAASSARAADAGINTSLPALQAIVSAQLDILDSGQLRWQGELWPGMPVEIRLQREGVDTPPDDGEPGDASQNGGSDATTGRRWQARLLTDLPALGKVNTLFTLHADRLDVKLNCLQDGTATVLQSAALRLADGLQSAGIVLQGFASHDDAPR